MQHLPKQPANHLIPQVGHPPIALWDINYGLDLTPGGIVVGWRDVIAGVQALPLTSGQTTETTLFGGRRGLAFNGTTHFLRAQLPQLRRATQSLAIYVHFRGTADADAEQQILIVGIDSGETRLMIRHTGTESEMGIYGDANALEDSSYSWGLNELVVGAVRESNTRAQWFVNGSSQSSTSDSTASVLPLTEEVTIGGGFAGSIRRVAIYNQPHTTTQAAIIDAAWRGL